MRTIICLLGKSASGKDTLYQQILEVGRLPLQRVVSYTTRPQRAGEKDGLAYHFCTEIELTEFRPQGLVIEERCYQTVAGPWHYFTLADEQFAAVADRHLLMIATPQMVLSLRRFFGAEAVHPILVELDEGERLSRAIARERLQTKPNYAEVCRRFLADEEDFAPEILVQLQPCHRVRHEKTEDCIKQIEDYIQSVL